MIQTPVNDCTTARHLVAPISAVGGGRGDSPHSRWGARLALCPGDGVTLGLTPFPIYPRPRQKGSAIGAAGASAPGNVPAEAKQGGKNYAAVL
jgi:hypothetical protein